MRLPALDSTDTGRAVLDGSAALGSVEGPGVGRGCRPPSPAPCWGAGRDPRPQHGGSLVVMRLRHTARMAQAHAHLLLQADPGRADDVASYVADLPSVCETVVTSGPYDVIARVDLDEDQDLSRVVVLARRAPGLSAVRVCRPA